MNLLTMTESELKALYYDLRDIVEKRAYRWQITGGIKNIFTEDKWNPPSCRDLNNCCKCTQVCEYVIGIIGKNGKNLKHLEI